MSPNPDDPITLGPVVIPPIVQTEIALLNLSKAWAPRDFAFVARAVEIQISRDFLPLWRDAILAFGDVVMPVVAYSSTEGLPAGSFAPISILDDIQQNGALGFHDWELEAWGRTLPNSVTVSHEVLEMLADPKCNAWCQGPTALIAREVCDPCEAQQYGIDVTLGDETRTVQVSNFVTPRYFEMGFGPSGQAYDFLGQLTAPFQSSVGGYQIVKSTDGTVSNVFAEGATREIVLAIEAKRDRPTRTGRRFVGGRE